MVVFFSKEFENRLSFVLVWTRDRWWKRHCGVRPYEGLVMCEGGNMLLDFLQLFSSVEGGDVEDGVNGGGCRCGYGGYGGDGCVGSFHFVVY